jgi:hypothetical protein
MKGQGRAAVNKDPTNNKRDIDTKLLRRKEHSRTRTRKTRKRIIKFLLRKLATRTDKWKRKLQYRENI